MLHRLTDLLPKYLRVTPSHPGRGLLRKLAQDIVFRNSPHYTLVPDVNGFRMLVATADRGIGRELRRYHVHEPICTDLFPSMVSAGMNVLDIGANIGYYALLAARYVGDTGRVVAVEPHPSNYALLRHNIRLNRLSNLSTIQVAISDTAGEAELFVSPHSNLHSLNSVSRAKTRQTIRVPTTTIDSLAETVGLEFALLRMDLEGWELNALRGGQRTLSTARPRIIMEVHPLYLRERGLEELLTMLSDFNYCVRYFVWRADDCRQLTWGGPRVLTPSLSDLRNKCANLVDCSDSFVLFLEPAS